jgi:hypothetical protein
MKKCTISLEDKSIEALEGMTSQKKHSFINSAIIQWSIDRKEYSKKLEKEETFCKEKNAESLWYAIRGSIDLITKCESDRGGILVGNHEFATLISNGYGDGTTRVGMIKDYGALEFMHYNGMFVVKNGGIFDYDCCNIEKSEFIPLEDGTYFSFSYDRIIALEKQKERDF